MNIEQQSQYKVLFTDNKRQFCSIYSLPLITSSMFRTYPCKAGTCHAGQPPDGETDTAMMPIHPIYTQKARNPPLMTSMHAALDHPEQSRISCGAKSQPPAAILNHLWHG